MASNANVAADHCSVQAQRRPIRPYVGRSLLITVGILMTLGTTCDIAGGFITINWTASLPYGLYRKAADGPIAKFCISQDQAQGVPLIAGSCPSGIMPLMKPVIRGGHDIDLEADGIRIDGKLMPNTAPLEKTHEGKPLEHYPYGHYRSDGNHIWPISTFNARSFDARYYGPISPKSIIGYEKPVIVWP